MTVDEAAGGPEALRVAAGVTVPVRELTWRFSASGGPGGQHVNTANTRAEVSFDIAASPSLPEWARERLLARIGPTISVAAADRRSQLRNRDLALSRLTTKLATALEVKAERRPTRPSRASQRRRIEQKRRRGEVKRGRRQPPDD